MKNKHYLLNIFKITFKAYKPYYLFMILASLFQTLTTLYGVYSISIIIKYLEINEYKKSLIALLILLIIETILLFFNALLKRCVDIGSFKMQERILQMISDKLMSVSFSYLEDPNFIELKKNCLMGINNMGSIASFCSSILTIISSLISIITLGVIIFSFEPILLVIITIGVLLTLFVTFLSVRVQMTLYKDLLPINYKYGYYLDTLLSSKNGKDFRLYNNTYEVVEGRFIEYSNKIHLYFKKMFLRMYLFNASQLIIKALVSASIYIVVGIKTLSKHLPISTFSLTVSSALSLSQNIGNIIESTGNFTRSIQYLAPLVDLMNAKDLKDEGKEELKEINTLEFKNVTFNYPNNDKIILNNISFKINKGEKISIVGLNGAGKTTIIKLLCRLYEPTNGEILINNINIKEYKYDNYINLISTVFQDFKLINYTIKENINPDYSNEKIEKIIDEVGLTNTINKLPNKYESYIGKSYEENGVELSGGEMQKIAIARALAKNSDLLILDEPTSALDPKAEAEIYENFNELSKGKTAIYISHRMSSSIFCDKILILDGGIISDFDSHQNLMKKTNSLYYKLFTTQAKNYQI